MPPLVHTWIEILAVITGLLSVYFATREDNRTWSIGILNAALVGVMLYFDRYYVNIGLQVIYILYNLYSWRVWKRGGSNQAEGAVAPTPRRAWPVLIAATIAFTLLIGWVFDTFTDGALPYWDAVTVALSLVAQYALTRKWLENWWIWIAANLIYIGLWFVARNYLYAALQIVFIGLSIAGYVGWRRKLEVGSRRLEAGSQSQPSSAQSLPSDL
jgi:nicotinamide mononucleotide transporter